MPKYYFEPKIKRLQFNLFGGTVLRLGTERHHEKLLSGIDSLEEIGCFG